MRAKHKNPIGLSAKPIPKVISFQDPLPETLWHDHVVEPIPHG